MSTTQVEFVWQAMFTDLDRFYFGTANENLGADLELNVGIPLF